MSLSERRTRSIVSADRKMKYLTPAAYATHLTATDDRLRNPDQLRRSSVAPPAPLAYKTPRL